MMSFSDAEGEQLMVILGLALQEESVRRSCGSCVKVTTGGMTFYPTEEDGHSGDQVSAEAVVGIGSSLP